MFGKCSVTLKIVGVKCVIPQVFFSFLQEVSLKEELLAKMESAMDNYRRKFAVVRHQQSLLYQDYTKEKQVQIWHMIQTDNVSSLDA